MSDEGEDDGLPQVEKVEVDPTPPRVLSVLSFVLERLVSRNDGLALMEQPGRSLKVFDGVRAPNISIAKYLERIYKYTQCSASCFVVGYVYMDRLVHRHPELLVVSLNVHRLLITSVMVAAKMLDDVHFDNAFYARVGGVNNKELNRLELELLFMLDFGLVVSSRVFESYCLHLEKDMVLWGGSGQRIDRLVAPTSLDDETEISVEYTQQSSSPPPQTID